MSSDDPFKCIRCGLDIDAEDPGGDEGWAHVWVVEHEWRDSGHTSREIIGVTLEEPTRADLLRLLAKAGFGGELELDRLPEPFWQPGFKRFHIDRSATDGHPSTVQWTKVPR